MFGNRFNVLHVKYSQLHCDFGNRRSTIAIYSTRKNRCHLGIRVNFEGVDIVFILWKLSVNNLSSWRQKTSLERRIARCTRAQALLGASSGLFHHWRHHVIWWQRITTIILKKQQHPIQTTQIQIFCAQNWSFISMTFLMSLKPMGENMTLITTLNSWFSILIRVLFVFFFLI